MASVSLSIWPTLREGMQLQHALEQTRVQQELRWLKDNPDYLKRLQPRLQKYLPYLLEQTRERRLPTELALIPIVESALVYARHKRKGFPHSMRQQQNNTGSTLIVGTMVGATSLRLQRRP